MMLIWKPEDEKELKILKNDMCPNKNEVKGLGFRASGFG